MIACRPVSVPKRAFAFCRYSLALLIWAAIFWHSRELIIASGIIMALSAILTVRHAPLVSLYTHTVDRLFPSPQEVLDINGMRFAHTLGTVLVTVPLVLLYTGHERGGWVFLIVVAVAKSIGALGFCAASRLYGCVNKGGTCCAFLRTPHE